MDVFWMMWMFCGGVSDVEVFWLCVVYFVADMDMWYFVDVDILLMWIFCGCGCSVAM